MSASTRVSSSTAYRMALRALRPLRQRKQALTPKKRHEKLPNKLSTRAHAFAATAARHACEAIDSRQAGDGVVARKADIDDSLDFIRSCVGPGHYASTGRQAITNIERMSNARLSIHRNLKRKRHSTKIQGKNVSFDGVGRAFEEFLAQQASCLDAAAGRYFAELGGGSIFSNGKRGSRATPKCHPNNQTHSNLRRGMHTVTQKSTHPTLQLAGLAVGSPLLDFTFGGWQVPLTSKLRSSSAQGNVASVRAASSVAGKEDEDKNSNESGDGDDDEYEWVEEEWELRTYPLTGREYIYNRTTNEIRPAEEALDKEAEKLIEYNPPVVTVPRGPEAEPTEVELRWEEHAETRADRFPYYLNRATGECVWTFPFEDPALVPAFPEHKKYDYLRVENLDAIPRPRLSKRLGAAFIDLVATCGAMGVYSSIMWLEMGEKCLPGIAILMFVGFMWRDATLEQGSRSLGKRYMGLEIVRSDGTLPSRLQSVGRSVYFPLHYVLISAGLLEMFELVYVSGGLFALDMVLMVAAGRRLGDYAFGTRVIEEQEDRDLRVQDRKDYLESEKRAA